MEEGLLLQSKHLFKIKAGAELVRLAAGLNSFNPSFNEKVDQTPYLDGEGFSSSDVTGAQVVLKFSGHRKYGDPAQDYIFSRVLEIGEGRKTDFEWTLPNGEKFEGPCTIANIEGPSGDANAKGDVSFEIHFNGKPVHTPAA